MEFLYSPIRRTFYNHERHEHHEKNKSMTE